MLISKYHTWIEYFINVKQFDLTSRSYLIKMIKENGLVDKKNLILKSFKEENQPELEQVIEDLPEESKTKFLKRFGEYVLTKIILKKGIDGDDFESPLFKFIQEFFQKIKNFSKNDLEQICEFVRIYVDEFNSGKKTIFDLEPKTITPNNTTEFLTKISELVKAGKLNPDCSRYVQNGTLKSMLELFLSLDPD